MKYHMKINYKKSKDREMFLQHPRPKWWSIKVDRLSNFVRPTSWSGMTYTPMRCTIAFILPCPFMIKYHSKI